MSEIILPKYYTFEKKFTIGLNSSISIVDYEPFLRKYKDYLHSIYFSPPLGEKYSTRKLYSDNLKTKEQIANFYKVVDCIRNLGIKIEICMNTGSLSDEEVEIAIEYLESEMYPDEIVCFTKYLPALKAAFPESNFIYSFNNIDPLDNDDILSQFNEAAVGKKYLFSKERRKLLRQRGVVPRLLLNNGCSLTCGRCASAKACKELFEYNVSKKGVNVAYAEQSLWPFELYRLIKNDTDMEGVIFKLSTRNKNLLALEICLHSYLYGEDVHSYVEKIPSSYHIWCGLGHFSDYFDDLDYNEINDYKMKRDWNWMDI